MIQYLWMRDVVVCHGLGMGFAMYYYNLQSPRPLRPTCLQNPARRKTQTNLDPKTLMQVTNSELRLYWSRRTLGVSVSWGIPDSE